MDYASADRTGGGSAQLFKRGDVLTNDLIATSVISDPAADTHKTQISYDQGKVQSITLPEPAAGAPRPSRSYSYGSSTTDVDVVGVAMPNGYARQVAFDPAGRHTEDRDAAGNTTWFVWDSQDRLARVTDPSGLVSTAIYDHASRLSTRTLLASAGAGHRRRLEPLMPMPRGIHGVQA